MTRGSVDAGGAAEPGDGATAKSRSSDASPLDIMADAADTASVERLASRGVEVSHVAHRPVTLDDPRACWLVEGGAVDVFAGVADETQGGVPHDLRHVLRAQAGRVVFGLGYPDSDLRLLAKGLPQSRLRRFDRDDLAALMPAEELARQVDEWVTDVGAAVASQIEPRPTITAAVEGSGRLSVTSSDVVSARVGAVVWVGADNPAAMLYLGTEACEETDAAIALTSHSWLSAVGDAELVFESSLALHERGCLLSALEAFHRSAIGAEQLNRQLLLADDLNHYTAQAAHRRDEERMARRNLSGVLGQRADDDEIASHSQLWSALKTVGRNERIEFRRPPSDDAPDDRAFLTRVLDASGVRSRQVRLLPQDKWWRSDNGALLAFRRDSAGPVALLPAVFGGYRIADPSESKRRRVNAARAEQFETVSHFFFRPLRSDAAVGWRDLLRFLGRSAVMDFGRYSAAALVLNVLALVPAVLIAYLTTWALAAREQSIVALVVAGLVVVGLAVALLSLLQAMAMLRLRGRIGSRLAAALWDRVLRLSPDFFARYTAGDLSVRINALSQLEGYLSSVAASALRAAILAPAFPLLLSYNGPLAWATLLLSVVSLAIITLVGLKQLAPARERQAAESQVSGDLLQFIANISKLRTTGAERSAYSHWARSTRDMQAATMRMHRLNQVLAGYSSALPAFATATLFVVAIWQGTGQLELGDFIAVYVASMTVYGAVGDLGSSFGTVMQIVPTYERLRPLLEAIPVTSPPEAPRPTLSGEVTLDHVSFRYSDSGQLVLDDVSIHVSAGEFVAIVGESGAGKSTLLRLALGLDEPSSGAVYYDGLDLAGLDKRVRRQLGVVTQDNVLLPGNLLENIIGLDSDLTVADAWRAAEQAALADDIAAMPLGMDTLVGDNPAVFSGGQIQRIQIAAALARKPRILFFDEATSFLDGRAQAQVMSAIETLAVTRIVIAHRLSTIRNADRIYVLRDGRVVQAGDFSELSAHEGPFRQLVERQMS